MRTGHTHIVLIVEDDDVLRSLFFDYLTDVGFTVVQASNADEARRIIATREPIQLVLTDINMPGSMDGVGLARWIAETIPGMPVILMSGGVKNAIESSKNRRFVRKPFELEAMEHNIRDLLS